MEEDILITLMVLHVEIMSPFESVFKKSYIVTFAPEKCCAFAYIFKYSKPGYSGITYIFILIIYKLSLKIGRGIVLLFLNQLAISYIVTADLRGGSSTNCKCVLLGRGCISVLRNSYLLNKISVVFLRD